MVDAYIAGAEVLVDERIAYADARGLSRRVGATYRVPTAPWRVVWHTMEAPEDDPDTVPDEGWELPQTRSYIIAHRTPPHLWALPEHDWVGQTVPLTLASYALVHDWDGYPETNHVHAVQIEVLGFARDGLDDPELCDWLGDRVLAPILRAGVPVNEFRVATSTGADGAGTDGTVRMTADAWVVFNGQCGHANVPRNKHWDPGVADYLRIARAANQQEDDDDMTPAECEAVMRKVVLDADKDGGVRRELRRLFQAAFMGSPNPAFPPDPFGAGITTPELLAAIGQVQGVDVDETALATALLAVLTPQAIAAAIPDQLAADVADELAARLAG